MKLIRITSARLNPKAGLPLLLLLALLYVPAEAHGRSAATSAPGSPGHLGTEHLDPPADTGGILGMISDANGAAISFAVVLVLPEEGETPLRGLEADRYGYYRIRDLPAGRYRLRVERIGYETTAGTVEVSAGQWTVADFHLAPFAVVVDGVSARGVRDRDRERFHENAGLTSRGLARAELKGIPGLAESDPLRAVEVLPGVVSTSDFSSAFNVRGGSADQNLILLDGTPIFNPFHLGGVFSVFNGDMVARADLHSGGFPAQFGGRVSSVLSVESDPGSGDFEVDAGLSLLAARVAAGGGLPTGVEEALGLERTRWRASARRSYFDWLLKPAFDFPYHLADVQGVFEGSTPGGGRLTLSGYSGGDVLDLRSMDDFPLALLWRWGNDVAGARWIQQGSGGGSTEMHVGYSGFSTTMSFPDFDDTTIRSHIERIGGGLDVERRAGRPWGVRAGGSAEHFAYDNLVASGGTEVVNDGGTGLLFEGYLQGEWRRGPWLAEAGVRGSTWLPGSGDRIFLPSPRAAVKRFFYDGDAAVSVSAGRIAQFLHSLRDEELPLGLDIWVVSGDGTPHVVSDQVQLGIEVHPRERLMVSLQSWARTFDGVVATNPAPDPNDPYDQLLSGTGHAYGADFMVRAGPGESEGRSWMLAVSWLRTVRTFPNPASGLAPPPEKSYPPSFDRRLNADLVLQERLPGGIDAGVRWNFGTGLPYTRPVSGYHYFSPATSDDARQAVVLGPRNASRYPAYHRLDLSLRRDFVRDWGRMTPYLDVLNVYDRRNVLFYFYSFDRDPPTRSGISMFPVLPTFGVEVSF